MRVGELDVDFRAFGSPLVGLRRLGKTSTMGITRSPPTKPPTNTPRSEQAEAAMALGTGQICHARPQSSGMHTQPIQEPTMAPRAEQYRMASSVE